LQGLPCSKVLIPAQLKLPLPASGLRTRGALRTGPFAAALDFGGG
jgi:hypothetical protein